MPSCLNVPAMAQFPANIAGEPSAHAHVSQRHGWSKPMSFEDKEAELGLLLSRMQNEPEDRHELYLQIRQKLNELKAYGMPLPETLVRLERQLEAEFEAEKGP
jgi:hypothetical protein